MLALSSKRSYIKVLEDEHVNEIVLHSLVSNIFISLMLTSKVAEQ